MRKNNSPASVFLLAIGGTLLVLAAMFISLLGNKGKQANSPEVQEGIAYLESLEQKDPANVQAVRKAIQQAELDAKRDELLAQLTDGSIDPFTLFKDYAIMGDSRAVGYWYWNLLDKSRVLADGGHTIRNIEAQMEKLVALNPSTIYLCYGLNDTSIGYWNSGEEYAAEYMQIIQKIQEALPDATIVVSSILPARDPAFQTSAKWRNIPQWSAAVEAACKENGILFANCDKLAEDYPKLWDPDGIHFRKDFYKYWASSLVVTTLMEDT